MATAVLLLLAGPTCLAGPVQVLEEGGHILTTVGRIIYNDRIRFAVERVSSWLRVRSWSLSAARRRRCESPSID